MKIWKSTKNISTRFSLTLTSKYLFTTLQKDERDIESCLYIKPKFYAEANLNKNNDYYEYENMKLKSGIQDDYELLGILGEGRYSKVYEGINVVNDDRVVVKILKPVKIRRIKREIKILQNLQEGQNIVKLKDFIVDRGSRTPSIVYEYADSVPWSKLYLQLTDSEIRLFIFKVLQALDYSNMMGIMHRDIKPHNIIFHPSTYELKLIDWGLAEFYFPGQEYSCRVASRHYKGPELLLNNRKYDYSLDIWSLGCVLAGIIFKKIPFFSGNDNFDQLIKITKILGTEDMFKYVDKYRLNTKDIPIENISNSTKKSLNKFINTNNSHLCCPESIDLLNKMLVYDHAERITPREALEHPYFNPIKETDKL